MSFITRVTRALINYPSKEGFPLTLSSKIKELPVPHPILTETIQERENQKKSNDFKILKGIAIAGLCGFVGAALNSSKKTAEDLQEAQISNLLDEAKKSGIHFGIELRKEPRNVRERYNALERMLVAAEATLLAVQYRNLLRKNQPVTDTQFNPLSEINVIETLLTDAEQYAKTKGDTHLALGIEQFRIRAISKGLLFQKQEQESNNRFKSAALIAAIALGSIVLISKKSN